MQMKVQRMNSRWVWFYLPILFLACSLSAFGQEKPTNIAGKWNLSWEARIGTERDLIQFDQAGSKLTGSMQARLGTPKVSGTMDGRNVSFKLQFSGSQPFTLVFTGTIDGDKMGGKFEIEGAKDGYDWHGENVRPTNYSWTAVRQSNDRASK
jgi:hypothetical protein